MVGKNICVVNYFLKYINYNIIIYSSGNKYRVLNKILYDEHAIQLQLNIEYQRS